MDQQQQSSLMVLNLRHLRVGPKILESLQKPKYEFDLHSLWLGPTFSNTVTLDSIVSSLPRNLHSLDLDLTRLFSLEQQQQRTIRCSGGGITVISRNNRPTSKSSSTNKDWVCKELTILLEGLPQSLHKLCLRFPKQQRQQQQQQQQQLDGSDTDDHGSGSSSTGNDIFISALAQTLILSNTSSTARITTLDLRSNDMDDNDAITIATALTTIQHQKQHHQKTPSTSSYSSSSTFFSGISLQHLNLSLNHIGWKGMVALLQALNFTNIQSLDLSHNNNLNITNNSTGADDDDDEAAAAAEMMIQEVCKALETNQHLQELNLIGNFPQLPPPTTTTVAAGNEQRISSGTTSKNPPGSLLLQLQSALLQTLKLHNFTIQRILFQSKRPKRHDPRESFYILRQQTSSSSASSPSTNAEQQQQQQQQQSILQEIEYWLTLNRAGRRLLRRKARQQKTELEEEQEVPIALWPHILARKPTPPSYSRRNSNPFYITPTKRHGVGTPPPDGLFFLLRQNPGLFDHSLT